MASFVDRMKIDWADYATSGGPWHVNPPHFDWDYGTYVARAGDFEIDVVTGAILSASKHRGNMPGRWGFVTLPQDKAVPRPANMVRADVLARAQSWFDKLERGMLDDVELLSVRYFDERTNPWNYPWWKVRWRPRFHGHLCRHDYYQATWYDDDVFCGFVRTLAASPSPPRVRLTAAEASHVAASRATSAYVERELGIVDSRETAGQPGLWWVRPVPPRAALDAQEGPPDKRIRLAWVLLFYSGPGSTGEPYEVWVDAEDGEMLGVDGVAP